MTKSKKDLLTGMSAQQTFFDKELVEGCLDVSMAFRASLSKAISGLAHSRWQIAARISELANRNISKDMLDKYTSSNLDYALHAEDLPALCHVCGSIEPAQILLDPLGYEVISPTDGDLVRLARLEKQKVILDMKINDLRRKAGLR